MSHSETKFKVCHGSQCKFAGSPQAIKNFRVKSRNKANEKIVYRHKLCIDCEKLQRRKAKVNSNPLSHKVQEQKCIVQNKELSIVHDNSPREAFLSNENILNDYNSKNPTHILTIKDFESAITAFKMLSRWKTERQTLSQSLSNQTKSIDFNN
jgi:hypothetical protein